jgi:hypothetical protein
MDGTDEDEDMDKEVCWCSRPNCQGSLRAKRTRQRHTRLDRQKRRKTQNSCDSPDEVVDMDRQMSAPDHDSADGSHSHYDLVDDSPNDNPGGDPGGDSEVSDDGDPGGDSDVSDDGGSSYASCQYPATDSVFSLEQQDIVDLNKQLCSAPRANQISNLEMTVLESIVIILLLSDESSLGYNTTMSIFMVRRCRGVWCELQPLQLWQRCGRNNKKKLPPPLQEKGFHWWPV